MLPTTRPDMAQRKAVGFTLIEVLVALAIVAVTLGAGIKAAEVSEAQWCADNQLTNLKLTKQYPGVGDSDFKCEQMGLTYNGKLVVRPTPNPNFRRVDAQITNPAGEAVINLSTVLARY
jgi:general secretion pathway protein I